MLSVDSAGSRLVAVGELGRILTSDDEGLSWSQVKSPVSVDLLHVTFPTAQNGWAVGHSGVILHSADGGLSWEKQLDGRQAETLIRTFYQQRLAAGDTSVESNLRDVDLNFANGPEQAFLGVWFRNDLEGFAVGSFGIVLATQDGGRSWVPWMDRVQNPQALHFNAIEGVGGQVFIAGEQGTVWKLDREAQRFVATQTPYSGSFFGMVGNEHIIIAYGLRGNAYRSMDGGTSWQALRLPTESSINGATVLADGRLVMVTQGGELVSGPIQGSAYTLTMAAKPTVLACVLSAGPDVVVIGGGRGLQRETLPQLGQVRSASISTTKR
ncbi:WD40/YVTN/BNR-like repeat-containing protein [Pseudomonas sp. BF-R-19]|uniref:WD40/YVTN/BNR-like repeat-containing protein n=1 Tax=Pseudomonas sp. BF-R-19 TaxID=2832397 RepID=UPI001CBEB1CB|nr:YCF48-related protein [Pseudomonas sp. BF-R-19]